LGLVACGLAFALESTASVGPGPGVGGGEVRIDEARGEARLSIPIEVPPGPGGLAPRLSLEYSSGMGNGALGVGWRLPPGEIRCALRRGLPPQPGCEELELDGQLLVGPDASGAWHTFVESFARIRRLADGAWEVTRLDGRVHLYGSSAESRIVDAGEVVGWLLAEIRDPYGNRISIDYEALGDVGRRHATVIEYGPAGRRRIELQYEPRPDPIYDHRTGGERSLTQRLREIRILVDGTKVHSRWVLGYEETSSAGAGAGLSRLVWLQRFGTDCTLAESDPVTSCVGLPPRRFSYGEGGEAGELAWQAQSAGDWAIPFPVKAQLDYMLRDFHDTQVGDVNGDGLPDLIHDPLASEVWAYASDRPAIYLSHGRGWETPAWQDASQETGPLNESARWTEKLRQLRVALPRIRASRALEAGTGALGIHHVESSTVEGTVEFAFTSVERSPAYRIEEDDETYEIDARLLGSFSLVDIDADGLADLVMSVRLSGMTVRFRPDGSRLAAGKTFLSPGRSVSIVLRNRGVVDPGDPDQNPWVEAPELAQGLPLFASVALEDGELVFDQMGDPGWDPWDLEEAGPCWLWGMAGARSGLMYPFEAPESFDDYVCSMALDFRPVFADFDGDGFLDIMALEASDPDSLYPGDIRRLETGPDGFGLPGHRVATSATRVWLQIPEAQPGKPRWQKSEELALPFPHVWLRHGRGDRFDFLGVAPNTSDAVSYDAGIRVVDLDRDGRADVVWTDPSAIDAGTGPRKGRLGGPNVARGVLLNRGRGDGGASSAWCSSRAFGIAPDPGPTSPLESAVPLCEAALRFEPPEGEAFVADGDGRPTELRFADVNGDGWTDLVRTHEDEDKRKAWLHDPDALSVWALAESFRPPLPTNYLYGQRQTLGTLLFDANADAVTDFLSDGIRPDPGDPWVPISHLGASAFPDLLTRYENGRGGVVEIGYESAAAQRDTAVGEGLEHEAWVHALEVGETIEPSLESLRWTARPVASTLRITSPSVLTPATTRLRYGHPRWDRSRRIELGFRVVEREDPDGSSTTTFYYQQPGRTGRRSRQTLRDTSGRPLRHLAEEWERPDPSEVTGGWGGSPGVEHARIGRLVRRVLRNEYGATPGERTGAIHEWEFRYDGEGEGYNFVTSLVSRRPSSTLYTLRTRSEDPLHHLMRLPAEIRQYDGDPSGRLLRETRFEYTDAAGASTRGRVGLRSERVQSRDGSEAARWRELRFEYDVFGNLARRTELGDPSTNEDDRTTRYCYDGDPGCVRGQASHSILSGIQDPLGHWRYLEPGPSLAQPEAIRSDYVDEPTRLFTYDAFGRLVSRWLVGEGEADEEASKIQEIFYDDHAQPAPRQEVRDHADAAGSKPLWHATQEDGFGGVWKRIEAVDGGRYRGRARFVDPSASATIETFDLACTVSGIADPTCSSMTSAAPGVVTRMDPLGRILRRERPDGTSVQHYRSAFLAASGSEVDVLLEKNARGDLVERWLDGDRTLLVRECGESIAPEIADLAGESCRSGDSSAVAETRYAWEPTGELATIWDAVAMGPGGDVSDPAHRVDYRYDTLGHITRLDDPNAGTVMTTYDSFGAIQRTSDARPGNHLSFRYDKLGRPTVMTRPEHPIAFLYREGQRGLHKEAGPGYTVRLDYDPYGRVRKRSRSTDFMIATDYEYDLLGRTIAITHPVEIAGIPVATRYEYEGAYLKRVCDPGTSGSCDESDGSVQVYLRDVVYDALGRREKLVMPAGERSFAYDPSSRWLTRDRFDAGHASGYWVEFLYRDGGTDADPGPALYDEIGNLLELRGSSSEPTPSFSALYTYDQRSRLASWTRVVDGRPLTSTYGYDALGNLVDHAGDSQTYDPARPHALQTRSAGATTYSHDVAGQLASMRSAGSTRHFSFDSAGRLVCVGESVEGCEILDVLYDAGGGRLREKARGGWTRYFADADFVWNRSAGRTFSQIEIRAFGERIAFKRVDEGQLRWGRQSGWLSGGRGESPPAILFVALLGAGVLIVALRPSEGGAVTSHGRVQGGVVLIAIVVLLPPRVSHGGGGGSFLPGVAIHRWVVADQIGSGLVVVDDAGFRVQHRVYEPFGAVAEEAGAGTASGRRIFAGHAFQPESGLYFMNARWFDAESGRFLSPDPVVDIASPQGHNAYSYAGNNPVSAGDPTGAFCTPILGTCFGSTVSLATGFPSLKSLGLESGGSRRVGTIRAGGREVRGFGGSLEGLEGGEPLASWGGEGDDVFAGVEELPVVATPENVLSAAFELFILNQPIPEAIIDQLPLQLVYDLAKGRVAVMAASPPRREDDRVFHEAELVTRRHRLAIAEMNIRLSLGVTTMKAVLGAGPGGRLPRRLGTFSLGTLSRLYFASGGEFGALASRGFQMGVEGLRGLASEPVPLWRQRERGR
jgi:RHS repeat-associated protein